MNSSSSVKQEDTNSDDDCEVVYNKADSPVKEAENFTKVTPKLIKEGLEIIKEVPSKSVTPKSAIKKEIKAPNIKQPKVMKCNSTPSKAATAKKSTAAKVKKSAIPKATAAAKIKKSSTPKATAAAKIKKSSTPKATAAARIKKSSTPKAATAAGKKPNVTKKSAAIRKVAIRQKHGATTPDLSVEQELASGIIHTVHQWPTDTIIPAATAVYAATVPAVPTENITKIDTLEIMIPGKAVGLIIGKKGATIRRIEDDSGAVVNILNSRDGVSTEYKKCVISGSQKQIEAANNVIKHLISRSMGNEAFKKNVRPSCTLNGNNFSSMHEAEPLPKRPKLDFQAGPAHVNANSKSAPKRKSKSTNKSAVKNCSAEDNLQIKSEPNGDDDVILLEHAQPSIAAATITPGAGTNVNDIPMEPAGTYTVDLSQRMWRDEELVSEAADVDVRNARNIINLFNQECTIPFIARYRKELTDDMPAEKLREVQDCYDTIKSLKKKVDTVIKALENMNKLPEKLKFDLLNAKTTSEVDILYAPFKPGSKKSLAERARKLGLDKPAMNLLNGVMSLSGLNIPDLIKPEVKGLANIDEVLNGIQYVIADVIAKDRQVLDFTKHKCKMNNIIITSAKSSAAVKEDKRAHVEGKETENFKFENYFSFKMSSKAIKSHQVLGINRGESQKILSVKVEIPNYIKTETLKMCWYKFCAGKVTERETREFMENCIEDAYHRLIEPHLCRSIRSELTKKAEKESVAVFCDNLKGLLLTPPFRGKTVLGIDPGFRHGCKLAVISCLGDLLDSDVIYPHSVSHYGNNDKEKLKRMILNYNVSVVAIGNGTACRETETWLSGLIKSRAFGDADIKFCIISEIGASIYSVSKQAEIDLPKLDPNCRSAVSIARRLQDPLLEYVKIEPKHLGVGMYQHDIPEIMLKSALDGIVIECVSFVGVDLNVCPHVLLRRVAGLSAAKAQSIVDWREKNGPFRNRQQLLKVKGLGPKSFEQCAGFVKIYPQTSIDKNIVMELFEPPSKKKKSQPAAENPLDMTVIHPESYDIAEKFLMEVNSSPKEIGRQSLIDKVNIYMRSTDVVHVAEKFGVPEPRMKLIIEALTQTLDYDIRNEFEKPLFRSGVTSLNDLIVNSTLTGCVRNVTQFGAFVDIGVGKNGLIHVSEMKGHTLKLGDRVQVVVIAIDVKKERIALQLSGKQT